MIGFGVNAGRPSTAPLNRMKISNNEKDNKFVGKISMLQRGDDDDNEMREEDEDEIEDLREKIQTLEYENDGLRIEVEQLQDKCKDYEQDIKTMDLQNKLLKMENSQLNDLKNLNKSSVDKVQQYEKIEFENKGEE